MVSPSIWSQAINPDEQIIELEEDELIERINDHIPEAQLEYFLSHPLDLNEANKEDVLNFPLLTSVEAGKINDYIQAHRPLLSIYELQSIDGLSTELIKRLLPYITIDQTNSKKPIWEAMTTANHSSFVARWSRTLQESKGYQVDDSLNAAYLGSPDKLFLKFKSAEPGRYSISLITEKDAGEPIFNSQYTKSFDFISAHLYLENINPTIRSLVLGDYTLRLGQGLILDNGFSIGKSFQFGSIVKTPSIIKPYQSVRESEMLRGIASKIKLNQNLNLLLFYSSKRVDGNTITIQNIDSNDVENRISSLQTSGLHRSRSEIEDKNTVELDYVGMALDYAFARLKIGLNGVYKKQNPALSNANRLDRLFVSNDHEQYFSSVHHQWIYKNLTLCGEWALDKNSNYAFVEHVILSLGRKAETMISYRNFHPGFYSDLSNTISTSTLSWNEKGTYLALNLYPVKKLTINGSIDFTGFPWLKYQTDLITGRQEYSMRIQYTERKKWFAYLQFRRRDKDLNVINPMDEKEKLLIQEESNQLRFHLETKLNSDWTWRSRIEFHWLNTNGKSEKGMLISQDLLFKSIESRYSGNFRFAIFDISDYDARIYSFENDVLYQYSLPAYNGRGIRAYINFRYRPFPRITLESRFSTYYYTDENQNGSGYDLIDSPYKSEIKFQIQIQF